VELSRIVVVKMIRRASLLSETPFEAGGESAFFQRIVGLSAQIFENLVGRDSGHAQACS
jgi:hypothetical protein